MADSTTTTGNTVDAGTRNPRMVQIRRVIPSYKTKLPLILGTLQIVYGTLILIFGITNVAIKAFVSVGGSSFLAALGLFACGALGILSARNKEIWSISMYMLLSIIAMIFSVTLMAAAGVGVRKETERPGPFHPDVREGIDLVLCVLGVGACISLVASIVMCSMTLFYGCCKQNSGARYIPEPQVRFTPENGIPQNHQEATLETAPPSDVSVTTDTSFATPLGGIDSSKNAQQDVPAILPVT